MPSTITCLQIKTRASELADRTGDDLSDAFYLSLVNDALGELYDFLVMSYEDYLTKTANITLVAGTETYVLPSDWYKNERCWLVENGVRWQIQRATKQMWNGPFDYPYRLRTSTNRWLQYRIMGDDSGTGKSIWFRPAPILSGTVELWYVPELTRMTGDSSVISFGIPTTWEDWLPVAVACKLLMKEESLEQAMAMGSERDRIKARIMSAMGNKDSGEPDHVNLVRLRRRRW